MFARGRIDGITDDVVNGIECYRCPVINIYEIFIYTIAIIPIGIQRDHRTEHDPGLWGFYRINNTINYDGFIKELNYDNNQYNASIFHIGGFFPLIINIIINP